MIDVLKDVGKKTEREEFLKDLQKNIIKQFELLAEGTYLKYEPETHLFTKTSIDISKAQKKRYSNYLIKIPDQNISFEVIPYELLNVKIQNYVDIENCYFDVTTALKADLIDIFMVILSKNLRQIYTFELLKQTRTYNDEELIHNLTFGISYKYPNLLETDFTKDKILLSEIDATKNRELVNSLETGINKLAKEFASLVLFFYLIMAIVLFGGTAYFVISNDWNWLEPKTFILGLPLVAYILNLFVTIITDKEVSLEPRNLKSFLFEFRRKRLNKKFGIS